MVPIPIEEAREKAKEWKDKEEEIREAMRAELEKGFDEDAQKMVKYLEDNKGYAFHENELIKGFGGGMSFERFRKNIDSSLYPNIRSYETGEGTYYTFDDEKYRGKPVMGLFN